MMKFSIIDYLMSFRDADGMGFPEGDSGYKSHYPIAPRIVCNDGFSLSVQATEGAYCNPRQNLANWDKVEVGYPSDAPEFIAQFAEDKERPTDTVYGYVPIELVEKLIESHGGPNADTLSNMNKD